jgi:hypothetical protein
MKTAVDLFYDELLEKVKEGGLEAFYFYIRRFYNKSKIKEKEQIEISFDLGRDEVTSVFIIDGEDYYNKKFNPKQINLWNRKKKQ